MVIIDIVGNTALALFWNKAMWLAYVTRTLKHDHKAWDFEPVLTAKAWIQFLQEARK